MIEYKIDFFFYKLQIFKIDMEHHNQSFFGQKSALIIDSGKQSDPAIFVQFLKKKDTGQWEKPSNGEGKNIKLGILEIIYILDVVNGILPKWTTIHAFGEDKTPITLENTNGDIKWSIPGYLKPFKYPETVLLGKLMQHILEEKIIYATDRKLQNNMPNGNQNHIASADTNRNNSASQKNSGSTQEEIPINPEEALEIPNEENMEEPQNEIVISPKAWLENLKTSKDLVLLPGHSVKRNSKTVEFEVLGQRKISIPCEVIINPQVESSIGGLWVKKKHIADHLKEIMGTS
jgi:hypothetical protein